MAFNTQSLAKMQDHLERMQGRMAKVREHAEASVGLAIQATEVGGTAFAFGYANGRWGEDGELKVLGLPVDLGVGFALTGLSLLGGLGKYAEHGNNVGSGAIAAFAYRSGMQMGAQAAEASSGATPERTSMRMGAPPFTAARMGGTPANQVNVGWEDRPYVAATVVEEKVA
jgi:hypothetical protein